MVVLRKVGVLSFAKIVALLSFVYGILMSLQIAILAYAYPDMLLALGLPLESVNAFTLLTTPISYVVLGFLFGALTGLLYNVFAKFVGGIELDLDPAKTESKDPLAGFKAVKRKK